VNLFRRLVAWFRPPQSRAVVDDDAATPVRRLRERNLAAEDVPPQARAVWPSLDVQVATIGVLIHNTVVNPATGDPWHGTRVADSAPAAFAQGVAMAQEEAITLSGLEDRQYLDHVNEADEQADLADATCKESDHILDDTVPFPPGTRSTARSAVAQHAADRELAAEREKDGDSRHSKQRIDRTGIAAAATALAAVDIMLLWRPLLNLGALDSAQSLYKWTLAVAFALAQALFIDLAVRRYQERERAARERRDAVSDANRAAGRGWAAGHRSAIIRPAPSPTEIDAAHRDLHIAYQWLLLTSAGVGLIGVLRVVFLSRASGQTILEATGFGSFVGLVLGALVLLLGELACRGNALGDRLRAGAETVAAVESQIQEGHRRVEEHRDEARRLLTVATTYMARARDTREWVIGQYWQALLLAARWLGMSAPPVEHSELVIPRELAIAETATARFAVVREKLRVIDEWLTVGSPVTDATPAAAPALPSGRSGMAPAGRLIDEPRPGETGGLVRIGFSVPESPKEPRWMLAVAVVATVAVAYGAAIVAPDQNAIAAVVSAAAP
jgi:hypothetical protein